MAKRKRKASLRNHHAHHPIMKKGGVHEKSRSAKRAASKGETRRQVHDALRGDLTTIQYHFATFSGH